MTDPPTTSASDSPCERGVSWGGPQPRSQRGPSQLVGSEMEVLAPTHPGTPHAQGWSTHERWQCNDDMGDHRHRPRHSLMVPLALDTWRISRQWGTQVLGHRVYESQTSQWPVFTQTETPQGLRCHDPERRGGDRRACTEPFTFPRLVRRKL